MFMREVAGRLGLSLPAVFLRAISRGIVPGLVVGNAETGNGGGPVFQLSDLLVEGHLSDQVVGVYRPGSSGMRKSIVGFRSRGGFHAGENGLELIEFRVAVQRFEAGIGEYLKEPRAAAFVAGMQFGKRCIEVAEGHIGGGVEGIEDEALAAEPLQAFENGTGFCGAAGTGQGIGVDGGGEVQVGLTLDQVMRQLDSSLCLSVEGQDHGSVE